LLPLIAKKNNEEAIMRLSTETMRLGFGRVMTALFWILNVAMLSLLLYTAVRWRSIVDDVIPATDPDRDVAEATFLIDAVSTIVGAWVLLFVVVGSIVVATRVR
jgi:hypothetical protein